MSTIASVKAPETLDSRGNPTIEDVYREVFLAHADEASPA